MSTVAFLNGSAFDAFAEKDRQIGLRKANRLIQHILERYGTHAFGSSRLEAAAHEAGHAIIYAAEGFPVTSVSISDIEVPAGVWGRVSFHTGSTKCNCRPAITPNSSLSKYEQFLRQILAGWVGEAFAFTNEQVRVGSSIDERIAAVMLAEHISRQTERPIESILAKQYAIITATLRTHNTVYKKLIKLLLKNSTISKSELSLILADVTLLEEPNPSDYMQAVEVVPLLFVISRL